MTELSTRVVFIAGPTASGKSAAALEVAERTGAEIINADAIQVYRDLEIISARPGLQELSRAPHHLFGFLDGAERCSAGRWARAAAERIARIGGKNAAVVVGGSGLYFRALAQGLSPIPDAPAPLRAELARRREELGADAFRRELLARDPGSAKFAPGDAARIMRAYEVLEATGRSIHDFHGTAGEALIAAPLSAVVIEPERSALYRACEERFDRMMAGGALDEARRLLARRLDPGLPVMKALGAAELLDALSGRCTLAEAVERAKRNTRRFAKRQLTWFRGQAPHWRRAVDWRTAAVDIVRRLS
jgi:tRNA dimethylallyltransferase